MMAWERKASERWKRQQEKTRKRARETATQKKNELEEKMKAVWENIQNRFMKRSKYWKKSGDEMKLGEKADRNWKKNEVSSTSTK